MGPFWKRKPEPEKRGYTDIVTQALVDAAVTPESMDYIAALEIAAGQLSRAFSMASVSGRGAALFNPRNLGTIGRSLIETGQAVWLRRAMELEWVRDWVATTVDTAQIEVNTVRSTVVVPRRNVLLVRWNIDYETGLGISPLGLARTMKTLVSKLERSLATEAGAVVGYLLPVPADGQAGSVEQLRQDLATLAGRIAIVETTRGGWGDGQPSFQGDYNLARMGPNFPESNETMLTTAQNTVLAACGYPVQLLGVKENATGQREAWRRYLHGTVAPLGRLVEQAAADIGYPVELNFDSLFASDIQGRARAFQSMVGGGMDVSRAATLSGLLNQE